MTVAKIGATRRHRVHSLAAVFLDSVLHAAGAANATVANRRYIE
jgi:hypothetical protein